MKVYLVELREDMTQTVTQLITEREAVREAWPRHEYQDKLTFRTQECTVVHVAATDDAAFKWATEIGVPTMHKDKHGYRYVTSDWRFVVMEEVVGFDGWIGGSKVEGCVRPDGSVDRGGNAR